MSGDRNQQARVFLKGSVICPLAALVILTATAVVTNPNGTFSWPRFSSLLACSLLVLSGLILAFLARRRSEDTATRLISLIMMMLNGIASIFAISFVVFLIDYLAVKTTVDNKTGAADRVFAQFQSSNTYYAARYTNAAEALKKFKDSSVSSLKSKEFLMSRRTNLVNFVAAAAQFRDYCAVAPAKYMQEVQNSGDSPISISNFLRSFREGGLDIWNEQYVIADKNLQIASNTVVLDDLLLSNFDHWHLSNSTVIFEDTNLQTSYVETAVTLRRLRRELNTASEQLNAQYRRYGLIQTNGSEQ